MALDPNRLEGSELLAELDKVKKQSADFKRETEKKEIDPNAKLQSFRYVVKNPMGEVIKGIFDAPDITGVRVFLSNEGYEIIEINKSTWLMDNKKILCQDVCICESRNHFKEIMKYLYGENISFRNSTKLNIGDLFITIISEKCWDTKNYIDVYKHKCKECGKEFLANGKDYIYKPQEYLIERQSQTYFKSIKDELYDVEFCCMNCAYILDLNPSFNIWLQNFSSIL